jgi:kinesin family protein 2/24
MEQYLLDNVSRYQSLVERFRPQHPVAAANIHLLNSSSIIIATRTRPILASETSSGQVRAVFPRNNEIGAMDIHELRRVVRGLPTLNVSQTYLL